MPHIDTEAGERITVRLWGDGTLQLNTDHTIHPLTRNEALILQDMLSEQTEQMPWQPMIPRLQHWWRRLCGEYVAALSGGGGDVMTRAWEW